MAEPEEVVLGSYMDRRKGQLPQAARRGRKGHYLDHLFDHRHSREIPYKFSLELKVHQIPWAATGGVLLTRMICTDTEDVSTWLPVPHNTYQKQHNNNQRASKQLVASNR